MEIVKRIITEKNYDKNGKVVSEKVTEEHFKEKITIMGEPTSMNINPYMQPVNLDPQRKVPWLPNTICEIEKIKANDGSDIDVVFSKKYGVSGIDD